VKAKIRNAVLVGVAMTLGSELEAQVRVQRFDGLSVGVHGLATAPLSSLTAREKREAERLVALAAAAVASAVTVQGEDVKRSLLVSAETHADSALALRPTVEALYWRAAAKALRADLEDGRRQVELASEVHDEAQTILSAEPDHAGAHHLLGRLHAAVMRLGGFKRFLVVRLLSGGKLGDASWESAEAHFRRALEAEPEQVEHKLELANLLADTHREVEARLLLEDVASAPTCSAVVAFFQKNARARLAELDDAL
jgi:hypothetical protein